MNEADYPNQKILRIDIGENFGFIVVFILLLLLYSLFFPQLN